MDARHGSVNEGDFLSICSREPAVESNAEGIWVNKNEYLLSCSREYGIEVDAGHGSVNEGTFISLCSQDPAVESNADGGSVNNNNNNNNTTQHNTTQHNKMTHKYNVHKDFRLLSLYTAPSGNLIYKLGNAVLGLLPTGMKSNRELRIHEEGNKYIITPNAPGNAKLPCCLFIHGGGFNFKAAPYHYRLAKEYALSTGTVTIMIDYRLAYNSSYGSPLQDCVDAWEWMCSHEKELRIDISRSTIIGDSAGGFLAIKTAMSSAIKPDKLMLIYPVIDCNMTSISMSTLDKTPVWNSSLNREMWRPRLQRMLTSD